MTVSMKLLQYAGGGKQADILVVHLGMSGQLIRAKSAKEPVSKHTHVVLTLSSGGQLRFVAKHRGPAEAERARRLLLAGVRARAALFPAARRDAYRDAAGWLASSSAAGLLRSGR